MTDEQKLTYTQVIDEKSGEIKYVPNTPPPPPEGDQGKAQPGDSTEDKMQKRGLKHDDRENRQIFEAMEKMFGKLSNSIDDELVNIIKEIEANNKKLRYDKRLTHGKLDGRRLTAYKTSDRLFKKKAIRHRDYQFTIMLDTSGSMFDSANYYADDIQDQVLHSKMALAVESIQRIARALEAANLPVSVIAMNVETRMLKRFDEKWDKDTFFDRLVKNLFGKPYERDSNMSGTAEQVAYNETVDYIRKNTPPKRENVVFVLSDGEPGTYEQTIKVFMDSDDTPKDVDNSNFSDRVDSLKKFWERQTDLLPYGLGIMSSARQIPRAQQLDKPEKLAEVMRNLIQEILL